MFNSMTLFSLSLGLAALTFLYVVVMCRLVLRHEMDVAAWAPHMISVNAVVMIVLVGISVTG